MGTSEIHIVRSKKTLVHHALQPNSKNQNSQEVAVSINIFIALYSRHKYCSTTLRYEIYQTRYETQPDILNTYHVL
jgi:hypothetical protein